MLCWVSCLQKLRVVGQPVDLGTIGLSMAATSTCLHSSFHSSSGEPEAKGEFGGTLCSLASRGWPWKTEDRLHHPLHLFLGNSTPAHLGGDVGGSNLDPESIKPTIANLTIPQQGVLKETLESNISMSMQCKLGKLMMVVLRRFFSSWQYQNRMGRGSGQT